MSIKNIRINNFRNLQHVNLNLSARINYFFGVNSSGKTSFLEAVFFLSRCRSFKSTSNRNILIGEKKDSFTLFTTLYTEHNIGLFYQNQKPLILKLNGESLYSSFYLSQFIVLQVITPDNYNLLDNTPELRRKFLDWIVFHVKHELFNVWKRYRLILAQRNKSLKLKLSKSEIDIWDQEFCAISEQINEQRQFYIKILNDKLLAYKKLLTCQCEIIYKSGWDKNLSYADVLLKNFPRDLKYGYTTEGINKSDFIVYVRTNNKKYLAKDYLSNSKKKILGLVLVFIQLEIYLENSNNSSSPILLIDDLFSEIDEDNSKKCIAMINKLPFQVLITGIDESSSDLFNDTEHKLFHVKQGEILDVSQ